MSQKDRMRAEMARKFEALPLDEQKWQNVMSLMASGIDVLERAIAEKMGIDREVIAEGWNAAQYGKPITLEEAQKLAAPDVAERREAEEALDAEELQSWLSPKEER